MSPVLIHMDFFERQDAARHKTKWLVLYFGLAVAFIVLGIYLVMVGIFLRGRFDDGVQVADLWNAEMFLWVAGITSAVIFLGSASKTVALRKGGSAVAEMMGGKRLHPNTQDPDERKLLNIVEEMALASGVAVPPVYLMADEDGINAFAAGHDPHDAVIGVTKGCMKILNRDELQGVIAHEFSHILNGDMRLNIKLMGVIFGILCIAVIGRVILHTGYARSYRVGAKDNQGGNFLPLLGLALIVIGSAGVFFGRLIQSAVSRQREFLADASAVQFTRNPSGIAGALKKIGGLSAGSKLANPHAEEMSHMFFGEGMASNWMSWMATHPPLEQRIRAIDPSFDGKFQRVPSLGGGAAGVSNFGGGPAVHAMSNDTTVRRRSVPVRDAIRSAGQPQPIHLEAATAWRTSLDPELSDAIHDPQRVAAVVYSLLLSREPAVIQKQLGLLEQNGSRQIRELTMEMAGMTSGQEPSARFPLVEIGISALRELTMEEYVEFRKLTKLLIEADRQVDLFEYALQRCIQRHLSPIFEPQPRQVTQYYSVNALMNEFAVVLSLMARVGSRSEAEAARAYSAAMASLQSAVFEPAMAAAEDSTLHHADAALDRMAQAAPMIKKRLLEAAAIAVASDGQIQAREAELLRAVADALDCPIPPFVELHRGVAGGG